MTANPLTALLAPCKMIPIGELGVTYESGFYAVAEAYNDSAESVASCNARIMQAAKQIDKINETTNDNK